MEVVCSWGWYDGCMKRCGCDGRVRENIRGRGRGSSGVNMRKCGI